MGIHGIHVYSAAGHVYDLLMLGVFVSRQQAIVLEGSYWKRRIEVVIKEYHKWRIYYKKRVSIISLVYLKPRWQHCSVGGLE